MCGVIHIFVVVIVSVVVIVKYKTPKNVIMHYEF